MCGQMDKVIFAKILPSKGRGEHLDDNPTTNGGMEKRKLSRNTYTLRARFFFVRLVPICILSRVIVDKNFCIGAQEEVY